MSHDDEQGLETFEDFLALIDEELADHNEELSYDPYLKKPVVRAVLVRQIIKSALVGMNRQSFERAEMSLEEIEEKERKEEEEYRKLLRAPLKTPGNRMQPSPKKCPRCDGTGFIEGSCCRSCEGTGRVQKES